MNLPGHSTNKKSGIALVMVLGFLALLIISAVSFSVLMRTERLATRNYVDVVKARNLLHLSLARAMEDIDLQMMTNGVLLVAPPGSVLVSTEPESGQSFDDLLTGEARAYLPPALSSDADAATNNLPWITIEDPVNNQVIGRYVFVAVDSGGFLDANIISGTGLGFGSNPREIRYDVVSELPYNFPTTRSNNWVRFETLPELTMAASEDPNNTFIYSRFPNQYLDQNDVAQRRVNVAGDPAVTNWNETAIKEALQGIVPNVDDFYGVMLDYAGSSYAPLDGNHNRINARRVPMINEVVVSNVVRWVAGDGVNTEGSIDHQVHIKVETWYPFPEEAGAPAFTVHIPVSPFRTLYREGATIVDVDEDLGPGESQPFSISDNGYEISEVILTRETAFGGIGGTAPDSGDFRLMLQGIEVRVGNDVVDRVNPFGSAAFQFSVTNLLGAAWQSWPDNAIGWEAIDPRLNWNPQNTDLWSLVPPGQPVTLGERNGFLIDEIYTGNIDDREVQRLYSNATVGQGFRSLGELSYLLYDPSKPWTTIRLLENTDFPDAGNPRELFDRLTLHPTNRPATYGLVNPNTWQPEVLSAVLQGAWEESYPNEQEGNPDSGLNAEDAMDLADDLISLRDGLTNKIFRTRSDMLGLELSPDADNKFLAESPLRNTIDLFDTQQNIFTIIIAAQATTDDAVNPQVLAEQRAVAVVWRDPYPDANGRHLAFVRYFRWLSE